MAAMGAQTDSSNVLLRICSQDDIGWLVEKCHSYYGDRMADLDSCHRWAINHIDSPNVIFIRTDDSFGIATLGSSFFNPQEPTVTVHFFGGKIWEIRPIFNKIIEWGRNHGSKELFFCASTGYNISMLAKRIGADPFFPTYVLKLS